MSMSVCGWVRNSFGDIRETFTQVNQLRMAETRGPRGKYKKSAAQLKKEAKDQAKQQKAALAAAKRAAKNNKGTWPMPIPGMRMPNNPQK